MLVVIDTNSVLQIFSPRTKTPEILRALLHGELSWAVSNEILTEYQEIVTERSGPSRWQQVDRVIHLLDLHHGNIVRVEPKYRFQIISSDPDDNKFSDCAVTAHADYVITLDSDFAPLANAGYKPQPVTPEVFAVRHLTKNPSP